MVATCVAISGCTRARLFGDNKLKPPDEVELIGSVCTSDPAEQKFPVRVLFVIDTSIPDATYINQRGDAMEKVVRTFGGANYSYGVVRYSGPLRGTICGFRNLTPDGFGTNIEEAIAGVRCTDAANVGRDLSGALSLANSMISGDVLQTPLGTRSRTKYVVILLANGRPTVSLARQWCNSRAPPVGADECDDAYFDTFCSNVEPAPASCERNQYTRIVRDMRDFALDNGAQEFFFHVVYQRDPDASLAGVDDMAATDLFTEMALHGNGSLFRFPTAGRCDIAAGDATGCLFSSINLDSTQAVFQRKQLIVSNRSALATGRGLLVDTDQDGLDDETEAELGTDPALRDTDGDTLNDRLEVLLGSSGLDPLRDNLADTSSTGTWPIECPLPSSGNPRAFPPGLDRDGDGLNDCEEILLRADPTLFDSDADGVPDALEFRYGTNLIASDVLEDVDADGLANLQEYQFHLAPLAHDPTTDGAYRYDISDDEVREVIAFRQPFRLTGVFIVSVSDASSDGRATIYYEPTPDPLAPLSPTNAAQLSWRDPQDATPRGADPGRGDPVMITADGVYTLSSAASDPSLGDDLSVVVEVNGDQLPTEVVRNDVRLRRSTRHCFDFRVEGVQLVDTGPQPDTGELGVNFIDVFLAEVPTNNPGGFGVFRAATIPVVLNPDPALRSSQPIIELFSEDFLLFGE